MTLQQLARNNVRLSFRRYAAFFLSCTLSVMVFYVFLSFVLHPGLDAAFNPVNDTRAARAVAGYQGELQRGLLICNGIVALFSAIFILYSNAAFVRSRSQEFGLLTLLGTTGGQLKRLVFLENQLIAVLSLGTGIGVGIILSKLFFMYMGVLVGFTSPLPFVVPLPAIGWTVLVYSLLFLLLSGATLMMVGRRNVVSLLRARRQPRAGVKFRPLFIGVAVLIMGYGYHMALNTTLNNMLSRMFPILALVMAGTYLLFSQGLAGLCGLLQNLRGIHWKGTNMLTISRLGFRLRDYASILFVCSILIAVVITGLGTVNTVLQNSRRAAVEDHPHALSFNQHEVSPQEAEKIFLEVGEIIRGRGHGVSAAHFMPTLTMLATLQGSARGTYFLTISNTHYNNMAEGIEELPVLRLTEGEMAAFLHNENSHPSLVDTTVLNVKETQTEVSLELSLAHSQVTPLVTWRDVLVLNDKVFADLSAQISYSLYHFAYEYGGWEKDLVLSEKIEAYLQQQASARASEQLSWVHNRASYYQAQKTGASLLMLMGTFISLVFFVASSALIYFKLFTELSEDRLQYNTLRRVGLTLREMKQIVSRELRLLFFLPWLIGAVHSYFALAGMRLMLKRAGVDFTEATMAGVMVMGAYGVLLYLYYRWTRYSYVRQLTSQ